MRIVLYWVVVSLFRSVSALSLFLALTCVPVACSLAVSSELDGKDPSGSGATDAGDTQETSYPEDAGDTGDTEDTGDAGEDDDAAGADDARRDGDSDAGQLGPPKRSTDGLLVLYEFLEGSGTTVTDTSNVSTPLNLSIQWGAPTWMPGGGLRLDKASMLVSGGPATKVIDACVLSNAVTVEAWFQTSNLLQTGPARLVSVGADFYGQNLMLGQDYSTLEARLSTSLVAPALISAAGSLDTALTHVVYTRSSNGEARFVIDGVTLGNGTAGGELTSWVSSHRLAIGNEVGGERPWRGTLYLVAIYARALSKAELENNFAAGVPKGSSR